MSFTSSMCLDALKIAHPACTTSWTLVQLAGFLSFVWQYEKQGMKAAPSQFHGLKVSVLVSKHVVHAHQCFPAITMPADEYNGSVAFFDNS